MGKRLVCRWALIISCLASFVSAQQPFHFNIGGGPGVPIGNTSHFAKTGGNVVVGAGVTMAPHVALNAEYMYHSLPVKGDVIRRLRVPDASARLHAITGNLLVAFGSHAVSAYGVAGGGWYHRSWDITRPALGTRTECDAALLWFGIFDCHDEVDLTDKKIASNSESASGWNTGGGIMIGLGRETSAKFYAEIRYHRAFHKGINTEVLPITFGFRW
jgi:hypothetical protein